MVWSHFGRHATVNKVHNTADLSCELRPKFLSTIMNAECSNYSEMQICPHLRFTPEYINTQKKIHYSENLPRAKRLLIVQIFNSRRTTVVNKRCSPTTRCFYQSKELIRTIPRRTTQQLWLHGYSGAPPSQRMFEKIRVETRVTRQATRFFLCVL